MPSGTPCVTDTRTTKEMLSSIYETSRAATPLDLTGGVLLSDGSQPAINANLFRTALPFMGTNYLDLRVTLYVTVEQCTTAVRVPGNG